MSFDSPSSPKTGGTTAGYISLTDRTKYVVIEILRRYFDERYNSGELQNVQISQNTKLNITKPSIFDEFPKTDIFLPCILVLVSNGIRENKSIGFDFWQDIRNPLPPYNIIAERYGWSFEASVNIRLYSLNPVERRILSDEIALCFGIFKKKNIAQVGVRFLDFVFTGEGSKNIDKVRRAYFSNYTLKLFLENYQDIPVQSITNIEVVSSGGFQSNEGNFNFLPPPSLFKYSAEGS
jgi:hypothetical protein